jgi:hypothetical protein
MLKHEFVHSCFPALERPMPIRPQYKWFYPIDWPQLSAMIRFERAKGRCERCGRPHGHEILHLGDGRWWDEDERTWRNGRGRALPRLAQPWSGKVRLARNRLWGRKGGGCAMKNTLALSAAAITLITAPV